MTKILIATTNLGKFAEFFAEFEDLNFVFVNLKDLKLDKMEVPEPFSTTWENALYKAKVFAQKRFAHHCRRHRFWRGLFKR